MPCTAWWMCGPLAKPARARVRSRARVRQLDPLEHRRAEVLEQRGLTGSAVLKSRRQISKDAIEFLAGIRPN